MVCFGYFIEFTCCAIESRIVDEVSYLYLPLLIRFNNKVSNRYEPYMLLLSLILGFLSTQGWRQRSCSSNRILSVISILLDEDNETVPLPSFIRPTASLNS